MTHNSGDPYNWPFTVFDLSDFKPPERTVEKVYIHCTCMDVQGFRGVDLVEEINRWHRADGWHGIQWHFVVDKEGNVMIGRPLEEAPIVNASDINGKAIMISVHGLWHFTPLQMKSLVMLCSVIREAYSILGKRVTFHGLSEVLPLPSPTFNYRALLGLDSTGGMMANAVMEPDVVAKAATLSTPLGGEA